MTTGHSAKCAACCSIENSGFSVKYGKRYIKIKALEVENIKNNHTDYRKYDELKSTKIVHTQALEAAYNIALCKIRTS